MKRKCSDKNWIQCFQTGLSSSYSRWVSQFAALTTTGPVPDSAHASRIPSDARAYWTRCRSRAVVLIGDRDICPTTWAVILLNSGRTTHGGGAARDRSSLPIQEEKPC